jgi:integrase/recombinase XerD
MTFAIRRPSIALWPGIGMERISTYLGHVSLAGTQKYLTMTPELREQASARFARYALGGSHE